MKILKTTPNPMKLIFFEIHFKSKNFFTLPYKIQHHIKCYINSIDRIATRNYTNLVKFYRRIPGNLFISQIYWISHIAHEVNVGLIAKFYAK